LFLAIYLANKIEFKTNKKSEIILEVAPSFDVNKKEIKEINKNIIRKKTGYENEYQFLFFTIINLEISKIENTFEIDISKILISSNKIENIYDEIKNFFGIGEINPIKRNII
tara:strand:+ start:9905 stop:10240 length:336 start_codon:yes stop_codon:yes gene_type:complete